MAIDQGLLKIILENHILKKKIVLQELYNGQQLETIGGKFLRVFIYRTVSSLLWSFAQNLWLDATKHISITPVIWPSILFLYDRLALNLLYDYICRLCALRMHAW